MYFANYNQLMVKGGPNKSTLDRLHFTVYMNRGMNIIYASINITSISCFYTGLSTLSVICLSLRSKNSY